MRESGLACGLPCSDETSGDKSTRRRPKARRREESQGPASTAAEVPEGPASGAAEDGLAAAPLGGLALLESRLDAIAQLLAGHLEAEERRQLHAMHAQLTEQMSSRCSRSR